MNRTPIAVPLLAGKGVANPYPSRIDISARGGPGQIDRASINVVLYGVTHPCARDLAVMLVHGQQKYLLMNNAGGCRPLNGTTILFSSDGDVLPENPDPAYPAFGDVISIRASSYGDVPVFPSPAPAGPAVVSTPNAAPVAVNGPWELFVLNRSGTTRGVIGGGWSLNYDTRIVTDSAQSNARIPGPGRYAADAYPLTFDLSQTPENEIVRSVLLTVVLTHRKSSDLHFVLESPQGSKLIVMANCGGDLPTNQSPIGITFDISGDLTRPGPPAPLSYGFFRPEACDRNQRTELPEGGPAPPYDARDFNGQRVRGVWKLWVYDDTSDVAEGKIDFARLYVETEAPPVFEITSPAKPVVTATQPFFRIEGRNLPAAGFPIRGNNVTMTWRVTNGSQVIDSGAFAMDDVSGTFGGDVPLRKGENVITVQRWDTSQLRPGINHTISDGPPPSVIRVNVSEFTYSLAEGATGPFFDLDVTLGNPTGGRAPVSIDLLPEGGAPIPQTTTVPANGVLQLDVDTMLANAAVSTVVHSIDAVPLVVERTMAWDATGYGGHGGGAVTPATRWLFAEGAQGFFKTFVLLANDNATAAKVRVKFLIEGGGLVTHDVTVAPRSRHTLSAGDVPAVVDKSFGLDITSDLPIIAERAMYFSMTGRVFDGGHESAGVNEPSRRWFLAEGATGPFFDCFVLISNPNATAVRLTLTYLLPDGETIAQPLTIPANSRETVNVERVDERLANTPVSTIITAELPVVAERAMYWPNIAQGWQEAHNSFGLTQTALRWGVADGRLGGARGHDTYILLANPNSVPAEVQVRFLKTGAEPVTRSYVLAPMSRHNVQASVDARELGDGVFAADIQVLNFQPIAVEKAMYWNAPGMTWAAGTNVTATRLPPR